MIAENLNTGEIATAKSLKDFFHSAVKKTVDAHQIQGEDDTVWYLTQLLCNYTRTGQFLDYRSDGATLTPLADYYRQAVEAPSHYETRQHLQRLGDVAIFISSLFSGALNKKPINVGYYISMGESAYATLADTQARDSRDRALQDIFKDLATRFEEYVIALSDIPSSGSESVDLLQQFTEWERTGHPMLAQRLRSAGFVLNDSGAMH